MIINEASSKTQIEGEFQSDQMNLVMNAQLFKILSSSLYECKEVAVVQEITANALDASNQAGTDEPIRITTPSTMAPELVIQDSGIGMDEDTLMNNALAYGDSTKSHDNSNIGGFGIGLKAVFSLADSFTVVTTQDGVTCTALAVLVDGLPQRKLLSKETTGLPSGTTVTLSVPEASMQEVENTAYAAFKHWSYPVVIDGKLQTPQPLSFTEDVKVAPYVRRYNYRTMLTHVEIGGFILRVPDSLQSSLQTQTSSYADVLSRTPLIAQVGVGELEVAPSRERIEDTEHNREVLQDLLNSNLEHYEKLAKTKAHQAVEAVDVMMNVDEISSPEKFMACLKAITDLQTTNAGYSITFNALRRHGDYLKEELGYSEELYLCTYRLMTHHIRSEASVIVQAYYDNALNSTQIVTIEGIMLHIEECITAESPDWLKELKKCSNVFRLDAYSRRSNRAGNYSIRPAHISTVELPRKDHGNYRYFIDMAEQYKDDAIGLAGTKKLSARITRLFNTLPTVSGVLTTGETVELEPEQLLEFRSHDSRQHVARIKTLAKIFGITLQEVVLDSVFELNQPVKTKRNSGTAKVGTQATTIPKKPIAAKAVRYSIPKGRTSAYVCELERGLPDDVSFYDKLAAELGNPNVQVILGVKPPASECEGESIFDRIRYKISPAMLSWTGKDILILEAPTSMQITSSQTASLYQKHNQTLVTLAPSSIRKKFMTDEYSKLVIALILLKGLLPHMFSDLNDRLYREALDVLPANLRRPLQCKPDAWLEHASLSCISSKLSERYRAVSEVFNLHNKTQGYATTEMCIPEFMQYAWLRDIRADRTVYYSGFIRGCVPSEDDLTPHMSSQPTLEAIGVTPKKYIKLVRTLITNIIRYVEQYEPTTED